MSDEEDDARMAGSEEEDEEESDEDSMGEGGASDRDLAAVMALEQSLQSHPTDYGLHAQYVALLRRCKLRGRLREACEAQAALFPLTEQQWRDWIDDEIAAAERCFATARMLLLSAAQGPAIAVAVPRKRIPNPGRCHRGCSAEDVDRVEALYERSVRDYLSVPLWASFIEARAPLQAVTCAMR
jgi:hypothetical protein